MRIETKCLIILPWKESGAGNLFGYAKVPFVDPAAGWPIQTTVENSREIFKMY